jgi:PAS domain S-box-containing protein
MVREQLGETIDTPDSGNEITALVESFQLMSDRLLAHTESLRQSRERMEFLLSATPAVIYSARVHGDFGVTFVSSNVRAELGYDPEEFTADPGFWASHIHPDDGERVFAGLAALKKEDSHVHEYRFRHKNGSWRWLHDESMLIRDASGVPKERVGYWDNVTKRRRRLSWRSLAREIGIHGNVTRAEDALSSVISFAAEGRCGSAQPKQAHLPPTFSRAAAPVRAGGRNSEMRGSMRLEPRTSASQWRSRGGRRARGRAPARQPSAASPCSLMWRRMPRMN